MKIPGTRCISPLLALIGSLAFAGMASGAVVANMEYIFSGPQASGTLNGVPFDTTFHFTAFANTADISGTSATLSVVPSGVSVTLDGLGTYDIQTPLQVFTSFNYSGIAYTTGFQPAVFLFYPSPGGLLDLTVPQSKSTNSAALLQWGFGAATSGGTLYFNTESLGSATFQAIPVPEASALMLSFLALPALTRRQRRFSATR